MASRVSHPRWLQLVFTSAAWTAWHGLRFRASSSRSAPDKKRNGLYVLANDRMSPSAAFQRVRRIEEFLERFEVCDRSITNPQSTSHSPLDLLTLAALSGLLARAKLLILRLGQTRCDSSGGSR